MKRHPRVLLALLLAALTIAVLTLTVQAQPLTLQSPLPLPTDSLTAISPEGHVTATVSLGASKTPITATLSFSVPQTMPARLRLIGSMFAIEAPRISAAQPMKIEVRYTLPVGVQEDRLTLAYYDATVEKWLPLRTTVDAANHTATATTQQSGQYALVALSTASLPPSAVIVDDLNAGFVRYGNPAGWRSVSGSSSYYYLGHMYWTSNTYSVLDNYAIWTPALTPGPYQVYAFIDWDNATTQNARYQIVHNGQTTVYPVNQNIYYAEWVSLGTYDFGSASGSNYVRLEDVTGETYLSRRIGFDAIAFAPNKVYLPAVMKPPAMKAFSGMHLGNRESGDWTAAMLDPLDGRKPGGIYPRAIVVQSKQVWQIDRPTNDGRCEVAGARVRDDRTRVHNYLTQAVNDGVIILIRIAPSPGNFDDWDGTGPHTLITTATPAGGDYCGGKWEDFRAIDDIVKEMDAIHDRNQINGWPETGYYFIPANEPNLEWYSLDVNISPRRDQSAAWQAMDDYFGAIINYARQHYPELQLLTPPMGPAQYAEGIEWGRGGLSDFCPPQLVEATQKGYDIMQDTYTQRPDGYHGYSWINYYIQGREPYATCLNGGFHVSAEFPDFMQQALAQGYPAFVVETDLCAWFPIGGGNCFNTNPLHNKSDNPAATAASLRSFFSAEWQATHAIPALWLMNDDRGIPERDWHEAYNEVTSILYSWFTTWWNGPE